MSEIAIYSGRGDDKTLLGSCKLELSQFVGKKHHDLEVRLEGKPMVSGSIVIKISICPINEASTVGVDTRLLLEDAPSNVKDK